MAQPVIQTAFSAGELGVKLRARVDLDKYHVGASLLRNFFVDYQGGATTRPGTQLIQQARTSEIVRVTKFQVSTIQTYALEWSNFAVRFYANDLPIIDLLATITGITVANPAVVSCVNTFANGDWVELSGITGMAFNGLSQLNGRMFIIQAVTGTTFELLDPLTNTLLNSSTFSPYTGGSPQAARIYTLATPYAEADLFLLKFTQSADALTITHPDYDPAELTRLTSSSFQLTTTTFGPKMTPPTGLTGTTNHSGHRRYGYTVTAVSTDGQEESLPCMPYVTVDSDFLDPNNAVYITLNWVSVVNTGSYKIYKWGDISDAGHNPDNTVFGYVGTSYTTTWTDNNVAPDYTQTPPTFHNPFAPGAITSAQLSGVGAGYTTSQVPCTITGDGTGATGYGVADPSSGLLVGFVLLTSGQNYTHATATFPGGGSVLFQFAPLLGVNPSCCTYFQQRRVYAASFNEPETMQFSQTANYTNFNQALIPLADDAVELTIASREVNAIKSMVPMPSGLVVLTSGGAFAVSGGAIGEAITPAQTVARPQASPGANDLPPIPVNYDILFIANKGSTVRDLAFNFYVQTYYGFDRSVFSEHLFFGHFFTDWTYAEEPFRLVILTRQDGQLVVMTYVPEQELYGWSHHDTAGSFNSVCAVSSPFEDEVYFVVKRFGLNFIEKFASKRQETIFTTFCVDCGIQTVFGSPQTRIGGLWHLIGQTVTGLADGMVITPQVVASDGSITLPIAATTVTVGLPFQAQLGTLELDTGNPTVQSKRKTIPAVTLKVYATRGLKVGPSLDKLTEIKDLSPIPLTIPPNLVTDDLRLTIQSWWTVYGQIFIQQDYPFPASVLGLIPEVVIGDTGR